MATAFDRGERLWGLNSFLQLAKPPSDQRDSILSWTDNDSIGHVLSVTRVNWNVVFEDYNTRMSDIAKAGRLKPWPKRHAALAKLETQLATIQASAADPSNLLSGALGTTRRSQLVSDMLLSMLAPATQAMFDAEDRARTQRQLLEIAAALAVHRAEQGAYPATLAELTPALLPALPVDLYHGKPIAYRRTDDGYLLFSLGQNGTDDGGSNELQQIFEGRDASGDNWQDVDETTPRDSDTGELLFEKIPPGADDWSIRLPRLHAPWPWEQAADE